MLMHDAHIHLNDNMLVDLMRKHDIACIANADSKAQFQMLKKLREQWDKLYISAGIHPWNVDCTSWEDMSDVLAEVSIIGEIGLDSAWCNCDIQLQQEVFEQQLKYACDYHKPVILHTKGMEQQVLSIIRKFQNTYLVHWYSHDQFLEEYIKEGCWFTIGPSVGIDEVVTSVAKRVPLDRLLIESDGLDAISWCEGYTVHNDIYVAILQRCIKRIAKLRAISENELQQQLNDNFKQFINQTIIR